MILLPTAALKDSENKKYLTDLLFVPYEQMSEREQKRVDCAIDHGELYYAHYSRAPGMHIFQTDLGHPEANVELRIQDSIPKELVAWALAELIEKVLDGE